MSNLLAGVLGALVATNLPAALSNVVTQSTGLVIAAPVPADEVEREFRKLMEADDAAAAEVDGWIQENNEFEAKGAGIPKRELNQRILKRLEPIRNGYEDFIKRNPNHVKARLAFASFLGDLGERHAEVEQLEKARELDPSDPAVWNNLANYYGHDGPVTNAFVYYQKATELDPKEPIYFHNFATTVFLFRKDAREHYGINEQQVFDKAMALYSNAMRLDPTNFTLATDVATSYYLIKPLRTNDALQSWTNALNIARDDIEREGVHIHLARVKMNVGRFEEARKHLNAVKHPMYNELKDRVTRNLDERSSGTNQPAGVPSDPEPPAPAADKPLSNK